MAEGILRKRTPFAMQLFSKRPLPFWVSPHHLRSWQCKVLVSRGTSNRTGPLEKAALPLFRHAQKEGGRRPLLEKEKSPFCMVPAGIPYKRGLLQGGENPAPIKAIHWVELPGRSRGQWDAAKRGRLPTVGSKEFVYFTSSITAVSLASPRRTPVRVMRV